MKKLTAAELAALYFLDRDGPFCPGDRANSEAGQIIKSVLHSLVKKGRATLELTDDGPRYSINAQGREDAARR